jgi:hypothetical protein
LIFLKSIFKSHTATILQRKEDEKSDGYWNAAQSGYSEMVITSQWRWKVSQTRFKRVGTFIEGE